MTFPADSSGPTSTGLPATVAGALAYLFGPLSGVILYVIERDNRFVRFHAAQSMMVSLMMFIVSVVLGMLGALIGAVPVIGWLVATVLSFGVWAVSVILWLVLMWQALQGNEWEAPFAGVFARRMV